MRNLLARTNGAIFIAEPRTLELAIIIENEFLERWMTWETFESVKLHLLIRFVCGPVVFRHAVNSSHHPRTMPSSLAVYINGLIRGIVHQLEKFRDCGITRSI